MFRTRSATRSRSATRRGARLVVPTISYLHPGLLGFLCTTHQQALPLSFAAFPQGPSVLFMPVVSCNVTTNAEPEHGRPTLRFVTIRRV